MKNNSYYLDRVVFFSNLVIINLSRTETIFIRVYTVQRRFLLEYFSHYFFIAYSIISYKIVSLLSLESHWKYFNIDNCFNFSPLSIFLCLIIIIYILGLFISITNLCKDTCFPMKKATPPCLLKITCTNDELTVIYL